MEAIVLMYALKIVGVASILHIFLPPYETLDKLPRFQVYYKVVVDTIGYIALNARGKMIQAYPSVQAKQAVDNPPQP